MKKPSKPPILETKINISKKKKKKINVKLCFIQPISILFGLSSPSEQKWSNPHGFDVTRTSSQHGRLTSSFASNVPFSHHFFLFLINVIKQCYLSRKQIKLRERYCQQTLLPSFVSGLKCRRCVLQLTFWIQLFLIYFFVPFASAQKLISLS